MGTGTTPSSHGPGCYQNERVITCRALSVYGIQKLERAITRPYRETAARLASALSLTGEELDRFYAAVEPVRRRGSPPRWAPGNEHQHNLPVALTSFLGREQELVGIPRQMQTARLLTLTGVGGSGKTRLALEVARRMCQEYRDGVWLVDLASITDPTLVAHRFAAALGTHETAGQPLEVTLVETFHNAHLLLVVDNCEHLRRVRHPRRLAAEGVSGAPGPGHQPRTHRHSG